MKVFLDGDIFLYQKKGGISRSAFEIISIIRTKCQAEFYKSFYVENRTFQRVIRLIDDILMNLSYNFFADNNTIYQSFYYRVPKKPKGPVVVFAYDMIQEIFDQSPKAVNFKKKAFEKADLIIAISQSTKNDLCRIYPQINPNKVSVVNMGVSDIFWHKHRQIPSQLKPYFIYVGPRNYPYKNFNLLLDVFKENKFYDDFDLVVIGGEKDLFQAKKYDWVIHRFCTDQELASFYSGAMALIYPSLYEGFGIPPIEAMAAGCPVIASNTSSMPEVIGDAGFLFNPKSKDDLADKMKEVVNSGILRQEMIKRGKERAKQFNWQIAVDKILYEYSKFYN